MDASQGSLASRKSAGRQRISSLQHADLILMLDDGQVIGAGDHSQLMNTCEEYASIAKTQMGDGKEAL